MLDLFFLLIPAAAVMVALPFGMRIRTSAADRHVRAVYLFHRSGETLATVASDRAPPFRADHLEKIVGTVRGLVDTNVPEGEGYDVTSKRFDEESVVAVRGAHVSVCAVFQSRETGSVRRDLVRFIRDFEGRNVGRLDTWEDAYRAANEATDAMSPFVAA